MRILTWNVNNGDFATKLARIVEHFKPDVVVMTEASRPKSKLANVHWVEDSKTRGIAVYTAHGFSISPVLPGGPLHRCVHGYRVSGRTSFNLLACWSHPVTGKDDYRKCWIDGIATYGPHLKSQAVVIAGDLNDNAIWDRDYPAPKFEQIFDGFRERHDVVSVYHQFHAEKYGQESRHSLFLLKNKAKRYHIDYILIPQAWMSRVTAVSLGDHRDWLRLSDHMPLLAELN